MEKPNEGTEPILPLSGPPESDWERVLPAATTPGRCLVVDDQAEVRRALERLLSQSGYEVELASDGVEAMLKLSLGIDLVIVDADMPGLDGFQVTRHIRADPSLESLPVVMVTGLDRREDRLRAVEAGVNDFLAKPLDVTELQLRCGWLLKLKRARDQLSRQQVELEQTVQQRTGALRVALEETAEAQRRTYASYIDTVRKLVLASEYKDRQMGAHVERIGHYCALIAEQLAWAPKDVESIRYASMMHDVGKIGVPDRILLKPGRLTDNEMKIMRQHPTIGAHILRGSRSALLQMGAVIALSHHEKWDGTGYPVGLKGTDIPLFPRVCAVADVFDAVTSKRTYRDAVPNAAALKMVKGGRGTHFDPAIADAFLELPQEAIEQVKSAYPDT